MSTPEVRRHPAWFGVVMGTGATSVVLAIQAQIWGSSLLKTASVAFLILASVLALGLWPRYWTRLSDRPTLRSELSAADHGALLATFPAGLLVLSIAWGKVAPAFLPAAASLSIAIALLVVGGVIAVALGVAWASAISQGTQDLSSVNGGWLIPPVMNLLVPIALVPVIENFPAHAPILIVVGFAFFGVGTVLFLAMFAVLVTRLALRPPPPPAMAPSLWMPLAPAGILGLALLRLLQAGQAADVDGITSDTAGVIVAAMGIGLGLWWALFAALEVRGMRRRGGQIPFHPGWWGFVFPVAALTMSVSAIGQALESTTIDVVAAAATVVLLVVWGWISWLTIRLVRPNRSR